VAELTFRHGVMEQLRLREPTYAEGAYLFVLSALEHAQQRLPARRHISAAELAISCRDLALERYGVMARIVLEWWGVRSTYDIGGVVFALVDLGFLASLPSDTRDQFTNVYDFTSAFDREYPWNIVASV
jgi:uncharacterized repeat protein (TIGR04138 family)